MWHRPCFTPRFVCFCPAYASHVLRNNCPFCGQMRQAHRLSRRYSGRPPHRDAPMIKRYSDHAANERTFLAWVRTAIAVMAFGFVIERFDLFLKFAAPQVAGRQFAPHGQRFANVAGLAFIAHRRCHDRHCRSPLCQNRKGHRERERCAEPRASASTSALAVLIGLLGVALFLYHVARGAAGDLIAFTRWARYISRLLELIGRDRSALAHRFASR